MENSISAFVSNFECMGGDPGELSDNSHLDTFRENMTLKLNPGKDDKKKA